MYVLERKKRFRENEVVSSRLAAADRAALGRRSRRGYPTSDYVGATPERPLCTRESFPGSRPSRSSRTPFTKPEPDQNWCTPTGNLSERRACVVAYSAPAQESLGRRPEQMNVESDAVPIQANLNGIDFPPLLAQGHPAAGGGTKGQGLCGSKGTLNLRRERPPDPRSPPPLDSNHALLTNDKGARAWQGGGDGHYLST